MPSDFLDCWFLTGPTASGKSSLALLLAERVELEIVAMDSMTFYRGMDIGTAKPSPADRQRVRHHLIDCLDPSAPSSVNGYVRAARKACDEIRSRNRQVLFVGGTPLYLKALLRGLFVGPPADPALRLRLEMEAAEHGQAVLHERLSTIDPRAARRIGTNDTRRLVRALEVFEHTGRPISDWQCQFDRPADPLPPVACLEMPRDELNRRIDRRVLCMLEAGWIEETKRLWEADVPPGREANQAVGYREIRRFLAGEIDRDAMVRAIQTRTRQFAKRQRTWFRHLAECQPFDASASRDFQAVVDAVLAFFQSGPNPLASAAADV